jgi:hypothetical protein
MSELPKIVYGRLRANPRQKEIMAGGHPDADLLSAFSEQTLSSGERENVLGHLSRCADCSEVVALSLPLEKTVPAAVEVEIKAGANAKSEDDCSVAIESVVPRNSWFGFARPTFGWAALAAGVALAISLLVVNPIQRKQQALHSSSQSFVANGPREADARAAAAPLPSQDPQSQELSATNAVAAKAPALQKLASQKKARTHSIPSQPATLLAENKYPRNASMADNHAPAIEKAKPALPGSESGNEVQIDGLRSTVLESAGEAGAARWQIEDGVLRRSYDAGRNWKTVLQAEHPLLSYASRNQEIWAGGAAGALFHSSDGGSSWAQVQAADDSNTLQSDVSRIDLQSDANGLVSTAIVISTSAGDVWNSLDGGKTWKKQ